MKKHTHREKRGKRAKKREEEERERENDAAACLGLFRSLCSFVQLKSYIGLLLLFFIKKSACFVL